MNQNSKAELTWWQLLFLAIDAIGLIVVLVAFANGGSFRILLVGIVLLIIGAMYSCFVGVRYILKKIYRP